MEGGRGASGVAVQMQSSGPAGAEPVKQGLSVPKHALAIHSTLQAVAVVHWRHTWSGSSLRPSAETRRRCAGHGLGAWPQHAAHTALHCTAGSMATAMFPSCMDSQGMLTVVNILQR